MMHDSAHLGVILAMLSTTGCEREATTPPPATPAIEAAASNAEAGVVPHPPSAPNATPAARPTTPPQPATAPHEDAPAGDPAEVARVLSDYRRIERFLGTRAEDVELSPADAKLLRSYLGDERFTWYESEGPHSDAIRQAWLERMSTEAAQGPPSTLRMPLYPNVGWGCEVPSLWVATGNFNPDVTFILPVGETLQVERCEQCFDIEDGDRRARCETERCSLQVEGHFTGKTTKPTEHCQGVGHELHIDRATAKASGAGSGAAYFLALPGGAAPPDGPPITEGPRWGVLFASAFRHQDDARARADALRARLADEGHAKAQVLDSRQITTLWCCSYAVLVDRFDDQQGAKTLAKALQREGFKGVLVRALY